MVEVTLLSVFLVGLLGGLHCAGMCGGIVSVMGAAAAGGRSAGRRVIPMAPAGTGPVAPAGADGPVPGEAARVAANRSVPILLGYNLGRITSYVVAGTIAGALGSAAALARHVLPVQQVAFVAANLLLIGMGLYLTGALRSVAVLEGAGRVLWRRLAPIAARTLSADRFGRAVGAGLVWGWVPCGMVYGVLVAALLSGSALQGALLMAAFGLGTLPNLLALGWSAAAARRWLSHRGFRVAAGLLVIAFGIAGLARIDPMTHLHRVVDACLTLF